MLEMGVNHIENLLLVAFAGRHVERTFDDCIKCAKSGLLSFIEFIETIGGIRYDIVEDSVQSLPYQSQCRSCFHVALNRYPFVVY